jgi:hypothetical protein
MTILTYSWRIKRTLKCNLRRDGDRHEDAIFITETAAEGMTKSTGTPEAPALV